MGLGTLCKHAGRFVFHGKVAEARRLFLSPFTLFFSFLSPSLSLSLTLSDYPSFILTPTLVLASLLPALESLLFFPYAIPMHICALLYEEHLFSPVVVIVFLDIQRGIFLLARGVFGASPLIEN